MEERNQRIVKNTGLLYLRSLICLVLSLYSSRLFLQALGFEDYGIYNAVGGFVSMFWMVSSAMSSSVGRFLNVEMGKNNQNGVNEVFSISLNILIILMIVAVFAAELGGSWFLNHKMTIPAERMEAAKIVFHLSVISMIIGFVFIPFNAALIAHEKMGIIAVMNIADAIVKLLIALFLLFGAHNQDLLILYAVLLFVNSLLMSLVGMIYCRVKFIECRMRLIFDFKKAKEMFSFAFWNFISSISGTFSGQGVNMVLNVTHGPILNSARGLANTVTNAVSLLVFNFTLSMRPQITQSYSSGDLVRAQNLVFRGTRFAAYLMMLLIIPLIIETPFVLHLWLGNYPEYTVVFIRLSLITSFLYVFDYQLGILKMAEGNIRVYMLLSSLLSFMTFPLSFVVMKLGWNPVWIYLIPLSLVPLKIILSIYYARIILDLPWLFFIIKIYLPVLVVTCVASIVPLVLHFLMGGGWFRFIVVLTMSFISSILSIFYLGCNKDERRILLEMVRSRIENVSLIVGWSKRKTN